MSVTYTLFGASQHHACQHRFTRIEWLPESHPHYAKEICNECGRFLRWLPHPKNVARRRLLAHYVTRLLTCRGLSLWQEHFVGSLSHQKKFSPKQEAVLGRIYREFFGGPAT